MRPRDVSRAVEGAPAWYDGAQSTWESALQVDGLPMITETNFTVYTVQEASYE